MNTHTRMARFLAMVAGTIASASAIGILISDALKSGQWTLDHALMPVTVVITILSGHLVSSSCRERKWFAAIGFALVFAVGTYLTIYNSVGRQTEVAQNKLAVAEVSNRAIDDKRTEIRIARERLTMANTMVDKEMTGQKCLNRCQDWKQRAGEVQSHILMLEGQLKGLGSTIPVASKASQFAELLHVFGAKKDRVEHAATLLEPFMVSLFFELCAIVAFGYAFASRQPMFAEAGDAPPAKPMPEPVLSAPIPDLVPTIDEPTEWVRAYRKKHGADPKTSDLMAAYGLPKTTAWKRIKSA